MRLKVFGSRSNVSSDPYMLNVETMATQPPTMYIAVAFCLPRQSSNECSFNLFNTEDLRAHCLVLGLKRRGKWKKIPNGERFAPYLGKGAMTRAYGYIYTIFGPGASHASLSKPFDKA